MLEGIETGYEASFDFPEWRGPPRLTYLLATVPRTGSTLLSHLLWRTGCLGAPLEYLNFAPSGPYGDASGNPPLQTQCWRNAVARRTSPNGVFGLKGFPGLLEEVYQANPALVAEAMRLLFPRNSARKVVELRRRDRTAHAISYARANLSGIWRAEQERDGRVEPEYSPAALADAEHVIALQEAAWQAMYRDLGIEPLVVWYEDVVDDGRKVVEGVARYLGIELDPAAIVEVPSISRQAQEGARAWAEAHRESG